MSSSADPSSSNPPAPRVPKRKRNADFRRAIRYLGPYRGIVAASVVCALLVGIVFTGGISAMLPIFKVLLDDQTIEQWVDRQVIERRLGVTLMETPGEMVVASVKPDKAAAQAGVKPKDVLPGDARHLSDPATTTFNNTPLPPVPWHLQR